MTEEQFQALAKTLADGIAAHAKRLTTQADDAGQLLRDYSEQLVRDVFAKEKPATDPAPSPP